MGKTRGREDSYGVSQKFLESVRWTLVCRQRPTEKKAGGKALLKAEVLKLEKEMPDRGRDSRSSEMVNCTAQRGGLW